MVGGDVGGVAGFEVGQQVNLTLDVFDFVVVLVEVEGFDGVELFRLGMNPGPPTSEGCGRSRGGESTL